MEFTKERFKELMTLAGYKNKKALADDLGLAYSSVNAWGNTRDFPKFLEKFLHNAIVARKCENIARSNLRVLQVSVSKKNFEATMILYCKNDLVLEKQKEIFLELISKPDFEEFDKYFYFYEVLEKNIGFERVRISVGEFFGIVKEKNSKVSFHTADVLYDLNKF